MSLIVFTFNFRGERKNVRSNIKDANEDKNEDCGSHLGTTRYVGVTREHLLTYLYINLIHCSVLTFLPQSWM